MIKIKMTDPIHGTITGHYQYTIFLVFILLIIMYFRLVDLIDDIIYLPSDRFFVKLNEATEPSGSL